MGDDPAAEFLQQEEDQLRELGIDENQFGDGQVEGDSSGNIMSEFEADLAQPTAQEPEVNGFSEPAPAPISIQPLEEPESLKKWREEKATSLQKQVFNFSMFHSILFCTIT